MCQKGSLRRILFRSRMSLSPRTRSALARVSRMVDRDIVRLHLLIVPHGVPASRAIVDEQQFRLVIGEGVPLNVVAVVVPLEAQFPPQPLVIFLTHGCPAFPPFRDHRRECLRVHHPPLHVPPVSVRLARTPPGADCTNLQTDTWEFQVFPLTVPAPPPE